MGELPVLELTTTGRKTGQQRKVMLTSPLQVDGQVVIVASRGGDDQHPAWFLNLSDNPNVVVEFQGESKKSMTARVATSAEKAEVWPKIVSAYHGYADYQSKTKRDIPVVFLS